MWDMEAVAAVAQVATSSTVSTVVSITYCGGASGGCTNTRSRKRRARSQFFYEWTGPGSCAFFWRSSSWPSSWPGVGRRLCGRIALRLCDRLPTARTPKRTVSTRCRSGSASTCQAQTLVPLKEEVCWIEGVGRHARAVLVVIVVH